MAIECPRCGLPRFYGPTGLAAPQCMCAGGYQLAATPAQAQQAADKDALPLLRAVDDAGPIAEGWELTISEGHAGYGVYAHMTEYPEEGAVFLLAATKAEAKPHPDTADAERYRWLAEFKEWPEDVAAALDCGSKVMVDAAIDAARGIGASSEGSSNA